MSDSLLLLAYAWQLVGVVGVQHLSSLLGRPARRRDGPPAQLTK
jgi:hypothetical protein